MIGQGRQLVVNYDRTSRVSAVLSREYSRGRVLAPVNYGF